MNLVRDAGKVPGAGKTSLPGLCDEGWNRPALALICLGFLFGYALVLGDRPFDSLLDKCAWVILALAALTDRAFRRGKTLAWAGGLTVAVTAVAMIGSRFSADGPSIVRNFFRYQVPVLWFAGLCLAVPLMTGGKDGQKGCACRNRTVMAAAAWGFALTATISGSCSLFPKMSMKLLGSDVLPYVGLFTLGLRLTDFAGEKPVRLTLRLCWLTTVAACVGMVITLALFFAGGMPSVWLEAHGFFRVDADAPGVFRLQFLFEHHNRCGFYAALAFFLTLAGAWGRPAWRWLGVLGACCAVVALPFTLTRGAMIALVCGMLFFILAALARRRMKKQAILAIAGTLAGAALILPVILPAGYEKHFEKLVEPRYYSGKVPNSISARFLMWKVALNMIRKRPVLGFGYGFDNFVEAARLDHPGIPDYFQDTSPTHNQWLETAAEQGIPGMAILFFWTIVRMGILLRTWWRAADVDSFAARLLLLWLSLEVMIQVYGLGNYALRRNLGYLVYMVWAGSLILGGCARRGLLRPTQALPPG